MKQLILDDGRIGLQRLQHAADADAARQVHVLADLGAGAHRCPSIDHRAAVDIGAEVDERRHQHHPRRDISRVPHDGAGHRPEPCLTELLLAHAGELGGHLVPPARPARRTRDRGHVIEPEGEQHRFLKPLIDDPFPAFFVGHPGFAPVEQIERLFDGFAYVPAWWQS